MLVNQNAAYHKKTEPAQTLISRTMSVPRDLTEQNIKVAAASDLDNIMDARHLTPINRKKLTPKSNINLNNGFAKKKKIADMLVPATITPTVFHSEGLQAMLSSEIGTRERQRRSRLGFQNYVNMRNQVRQGSRSNYQNNDPFGVGRRTGT